MSAIWPVGPPKFTNPSHTQNRNASANGTGEDPGGSRRAGSGWVTRAPYPRPGAASKPCRRLRYDASVGTDTLVIHGAREHNLKNITLELPRNALVVFTGLSGSGKSSLAFDTIYAEGQRRYVESLSSYARQFLGQMEKPDVDFIEGLSPAISIDQKSTSRNPRSTVGTITEIYDYLRLLYARIGHPHCPKCGRPIGRQTPEQIVDRVMQLPEGTRFQVLAPVVRGRKGEYEKLLKDLAGQGFVRARIDGEVRELAEPIRLPRNYKHTIEVVVDRLVAKPDIRRRLADSVESALQLAEGLVAIAVQTARRRGRPDLQPGPGVHVRRALVRRARSRGTSRSTRRTARARRCDGLGVRLEVDAGARRPRPRPVDRRGRARAVVERQGRVLGPGPGRRRGLARLLDEDPVEEAPEEGPRRRPVRLGRGDLRQVQEPVRADPLVLDHVRGRGAGGRTPARRDRLGEPARAARGVHARGPVPRVRRRPAAPGDPGRHRRRPQHLAAHEPVDPRDADVHPRGAAERAGADDRRTPPEGDPRAAAVPGRRRAGLPDARHGRRRRSPGARRSGSAWPPRSGAGWSACCTSWTSRRSACTSATTGG